MNTINVNTNAELMDFMIFHKDKVPNSPLFVHCINDKYIVAAYQGIISDFDIVVKYRQKEEGKWSRIRTPKHIHWAVDLLIKQFVSPKETKRFLVFLISLWNSISSINSYETRRRILNIDSLLNCHSGKIQEFANLSNIGEYDIQFLILVAKLLMIQEKANREDAYMFKNLLESLKEGKDIFKIVSIASMRNRR